MEMFFNNFMISVIVHLPLLGCQLRCYFFNEYNYQLFFRTNKGASLFHSGGFLDKQIGMERLLLTGPKKKRKSFVIFMFIANNSIFKSIVS